MLLAKPMAALLPALGLRVLRFRRTDTSFSCCGPRHVAPARPGNYAEEVRRVPRRLSKRTLCLRIAVAFGPIYQDGQFALLLPRSWPVYRSTEPACVRGDTVAYKKTVLSARHQVPRRAGSMESPRSAWLWPTLVSAQGHTVLPKQAGRERQRSDVTAF